MDFTQSKGYHEVVHMYIDHRESKGSKNLTLAHLPSYFIFGEYPLVMHKGQFLNTHLYIA
jgi:hypothetical protein